jgi:cytosolic iron-sulfur protein assembly protein CIAO1
MDSGPNKTEAARCKLTCQCILRPPSKEIGQGDDHITYTVDQPAWQCCFSRDGNWLAACYGAPEPCVRIWNKDVSTTNSHWKLESTLSGIHERTIRSLAFAPIMSPLTLATASFDSTIAIWERTGVGTDMDWECMAQLEGHENEVKCVQWNSTGSLLATCGRDKSVWIWECFLPGSVGGPSPTADQGGDYECLAVLHGHEADVKCVRFAQSHDQWGDGDEILLSASYDDTIKCWAEDGGDWYCAASIAGVHSTTIWSIAIAPGGGRIISASADGSLAIYKCYTAAEKKTMFPDEDKNSSGLWKCVGKLPDAHSSCVYSVDYAPARAGHGRIASCGADNRIQIYREAISSSSDQPMFLLDVSVTTEHGDVNHVAWHPTDGTLLASAGDDGTVRIWKYKA